MPFLCLLVKLTVATTVNPQEVLLRCGQCLVFLSPWSTRSFMMNRVPFGSGDGCLPIWLGRCMAGQECSGPQGPHALELCVVHLALPAVLERDHALVQSDNTSTAFHVNHQGGTRFAHLFQVSRDFPVWASPHLTGLFYVADGPIVSLLQGYKEKVMPCCNSARPTG